MGMGSESTADDDAEEVTLTEGPDRGSGNGGVLCVHAYGRLEEIHVQPLTLKQLRQTAKEVFDLPDTEILLKGPDGSWADSDEMLKNVASVYLELPDGGLHDLEQRIDQLQHMQVSHLCDRLATLADEQVSHQASITGLTDALIEEQAFRQEFEEAVRAEIKHECDGVTLHLKKRMDQLEMKLREHTDDSLHSFEARVSQDLQDLWQWTSDECRQSSERLKDLEQRVVCSNATAREASASVSALRSTRVEVSGNVKECLDGQAKLSARIDDLCDALVKEVQERMAEAHKLQHELSRRDERTESLRDFGQELHAAMTTLRSEAVGSGGSTSAAADVVLLREASTTLERRLSELSEHVEESANRSLHVEHQLSQQGEQLSLLQDALVSEGPGRQDDLLELRDQVSRIESSLSEASTAAILQLREECLESIQREVRSRLQDSAKLRQSLEMECKARKEAFGMIHHAVSQSAT
eukprot:symbB.v1.2.005795.t1/scaffold317.1/size229983/6